MRKACAAYVRNFRALLQICRALLQMCKSVWQICRALLRVCGTVFMGGVGAAGGVEVLLNATAEDLIGGRSPLIVVSLCVCVCVCVRVCACVCV